MQEMSLVSTKRGARECRKVASALVLLRFPNLNALAFMTGVSSRLSYAPPSAHSDSVMSMRVEDEDSHPVRRSLADIPFLKHYSSIFRQSSNPVCGFSTDIVVKQTR